MDVGFPSEVARTLRASFGDGRMWMVTIHDGGGSMGEAIEVQFSVACDDEQQARTLAEQFNNWAARKQARYQTTFAYAWPVNQLSLSAESGVMQVFDRMKAGSGLLDYEEE